MRVLFIKSKHNGDALLFTPMLTAVRRSYPRAEMVGQGHSLIRVEVAAQALLQEHSAAARL